MRETQAPNINGADYDDVIQRYNNFYCYTEVQVAAYGVNANSIDEGGSVFFVVAPGESLTCTMQYVQCVLCHQQEDDHSYSYASLWLFSFFSAG